MHFFRINYFLSLATDLLSRNGIFWEKEEKHFYHTRLAQLILCLNLELISIIFSRFLPQTSRLPNSSTLVPTTSRGDSSNWNYKIEPIPSVLTDNFYNLILGPPSLHLTWTTTTSSPTGARASPTGLRASPTGLRASPTGLRASSTGLRASSTELRASSTGLRALLSGM